MVEELERYGTGAGIAVGAGIGATAAALTGQEPEFAVVAGFGAAGGLVVGGAAGRYAERTDGARWAYRVMAFTLFVALLVGGVLGALTAWTVDAALGIGVANGAAAGGAFGLLLSGILVAAGRGVRGTDTPNASR